MTIPGEADPGQDLMSTDDAARFLRVDLGSLEEAAWRGDVPAVRRGDVLLIDRRALLHQLDPEAGGSGS